ncbi:hypothetical protein V0288_19790 [Pannus brasiliensis CCIBt3594]|uniref:Uncharacterized protein n=1 Tax=Pannus brasiliensis CCIBt3594 TaxID=1427578 RepID=A0AAW9R0Y2_9CHRO
MSETDTLPDAIALLEKNQVDGVLYTRGDLEYYLYQHPRVSYQLADFDIGSEYIGIALPFDSPLTRRLNEQILQPRFQLLVREIESNWRRLLDKTSRKKP